MGAQDRYSTEVLLQGFRGALTLLDRAGGPGGGDLASDDAGDEGGSTAPAPKAASAAACGDRALIWMTRLRFSGADGPSVPSRMPRRDSAESTGAF